jgi:hypothetical protein
VSPLKIFKEWRLFERHPSADFWAAFSIAWYFLPSAFFLEYGNRDSEAWGYVYYAWLFSVHVFFVAAILTTSRYFMIIMSPILLYAVCSFVAEVQIFIFQLDPNGLDIVQVKKELLSQAAVCSIIFLILLELFPWESLRLQTGP